MELGYAVHVRYLYLPFPIHSFLKRSSESPFSWHVFIFGLASYDLYFFSQTMSKKAQGLKLL